MVKEANKDSAIEALKSDSKICAACWFQNQAGLIRITYTRTQDGKIIHSAEMHSIARANSEVITEFAVKEISLHIASSCDLIAVSLVKSGDYLQDPGQPLRQNSLANDQYRYNHISNRFEQPAYRHRFKAPRRCLSDKQMIFRSQLWRCHHHLAQHIRRIVSFRCSYRIRTKCVNYIWT